MTIRLRVYEISPVYLKRRGGFTLEVGDEFISIPLLLLNTQSKKLTNIMSMKHWYVTGAAIIL